MIPPKATTKVTMPLLKQSHSFLRAWPLVRSFCSFLLSTWTSPLFILTAQQMSYPWTAHNFLPIVIDEKCCNTCLLLKEKLQTQKSHNRDLEFRSTDQYFSIASSYIPSLTGTTDILPLTESDALQKLLQPSVSLPVKPMNWLSFGVTTVVPTQKQNWASLGNHRQSKCKMGWIWRWHYFCVTTVGLRYLICSVITSHL